MSGRTKLGAREREQASKPAGRPKEVAGEHAQLIGPLGRALGKRAT